MKQKAYTYEGFVVLKGSHISLTDDDTIPTVIKKRRKNAAVNDQGILQEDMLFTSLTYAAVFVYRQACKWFNKLENRKRINTEITGSQQQ